MSKCRIHIYFSKLAEWGLIPVIAPKSEVDRKAISASERVSDFVDLVGARVFIPVIKFMGSVDL